MFMQLTGLPWQYKTLDQEKQGAHNLRLAVAVFL